MPGPVIHDEAGVRWVILDRPDQLNALRVEDIVAATGAAYRARRSR